jgi:hypothetical protein
MGCKPVSIYRGWVVGSDLGRRHRLTLLRRQVLTDPDLICPVREQVKATLPWYRRIFWW